ncbi:MAG: hypothetical protein HY777_05755 [Betaproteobacteria bacterium]|nr:hypothetical protein [Betaproteobacteria bacterium]
MSQATPAPTRLSDYTPPAWLIDTVHLDVDIRQDGTVVTATLHCSRNPAAAGDSPLTLEGANLDSSPPAS